MLDDEALVKSVLTDGEDVYFDLESYDLWLQVVFHLLHKDELLIYGMTEVRIEKNEPIEYLRKRLQKVAYNMWSKALGSEDKLYVVDHFDIKTVEEDLAP